MKISLLQEFINEQGSLTTSSGAAELLVYTRWLKRFAGGVQSNSLDCFDRYPKRAS